MARGKKRGGLRAALWISKDPQGVGRDLPGSAWTCRERAGS